MTPAVGFVRLVWAFCFGLALGLCFDIVRPIRPRFLGDLLFLIAMGWFWLQLAFGICSGDLRFGCLSALGVGVLLWEIGPGRILQPLFCQIWRLFALPFKKIFKKIKKILKFLFARRKKSSTIE